MMYKSNSVFEKRRQCDREITHDDEIKSSINRKDDSCKNKLSKSNKISEKLIGNCAPLQKQIFISDYIQQALERCKKRLMHIAEQSSMVIAMGDRNSTIIWTVASGAMRSAAEKVNFIQGGRWSESHAGHNALACAAKTGQSSCVFSSEHSMQSVHDWVCYAAPVYDPFTHNLIGTIDLSSKWDKHTELGILAAERCAEIFQSSLSMQDRHLYIQSFGVPRVLLNGQIVSLSPRQIEILCILVLHPKGINLEGLHQALYGDRNISMATLKSEMSRLKDHLGSVIESRPYKINCAVETDFLNLEQTLEEGDLNTAISYFQGTMLERSESPFLTTWRNCIETRLSHAIFQSEEVDVLLKHVSRSTDAIDAIDRLKMIVPNQVRYF